MCQRHPPYPCDTYKGTVLCCHLLLCSRLQFAVPCVSMVIVSSTPLHYVIRQHITMMYQPQGVMLSHNYGCCWLIWDLNVGNKSIRRAPDKVCNPRIIISYLQICHAEKSNLKNTVLLTEMKQFCGGNRKRKFERENLALKEHSRNINLISRCCSPTIIPGL